MSINTAEQNLDSRFIKEIAQLQRDVREIKSKQPVGADIITISPFPTGNTVQASFTLTAGSKRTLTIILTPPNNTLTLWNFSHSTYIDVNNYTNTYSGGSAWIAGDDALNTIIFAWHDWADSSDVSNVRAYKIRFNLADCVSDHTYYVYFRAYVPELANIT